MQSFTVNVMSEAFETSCKDLAPFFTLISQVLAATILTS